MTLPAPVQVFIGGTLGGALRIGLDLLFPAGAQGVAWDVVTINVVGSFVLGAVAARSEAMGGHRHFPLIGPGLLGGFTTFSAIASLHWTAGTSLGLAAGVLALNMVLAFGAAAWGWSLGARGSRATEFVENLANEPDGVVHDSHVPTEGDAAGGERA
ncbi:fluoride efflux transporter FluC [Demequina oxidasica]|uniref:fluoride efflux transporter FluC n=1 Tax=Demequina oxidasica TaxID=676199 RepID=UPI000786534A|nr:CrcB family protein [Demequina oxidasica]